MIGDIMLTFEITLTGDRRHRDALDLIDAVQQAADRLGTAAVSISPGRAPLASLSGSTPVVLAESDGIQINTAARDVRVDGQSIAFTKVEYDLLLFLAEHRNQVLTRRQLLLGAWGHEHAGERTVDVHVRRLRVKLGDTAITTIRGIGYRLSDSATVEMIRPATVDYLAEVVRAH
jgi:DNA-binding response OmpR family regulator